MKSYVRLFDLAFFVGVAGSVTLTQAVPLATVQNSTLSVPAADIAAGGLPGSTNLAGSNFMVSAVMHDTLQGGHAALVNSQRWVRRYNPKLTSCWNAGLAIAVRGDGSVVVAGPSQPGPAIGDDFVTLAYAPDGTPLWTNRYDGPGHGHDTAYFLAAGETGDVWVAGPSMRYGDATNTMLTDVAVLRYASNGVPIWTNRYGSFETNGARPTALGVDGADNAYVMQTSAYWQSGIGRPVEDAITKYDPLGTAVWTKHYLASAPDSGQGLHDAEVLALDGTGNLFVGGISGSPNWNTGSAIVKYAGDGTALWTNHHPFQFMSGIKGLTVDSQGAVILTGETWSNYTLAYLVLKCSRDGASLWTNALAGPGYEGGNVPQTVLDRAGNILMVGGRPGTVDSGLYQILRLSGDGVPLWTNQTVDLGSSNGVIYGSAVDSAGSLYLTGTAPAPGKNDFDYVTVKYSGDGQPIWTNRFDGPASLDDFPYAIGVDDAGNVYVTGRSERSPGCWDLTTLKYADLLYYTPPRDFTGSDIITYKLTDNLGNSGTGSVVVVVAPGAFQFDLAPTATRLTPGGMQLQVDGAPGASGVVIEVSPDLMQWQPVATNMPIGGSLQVLDSAATNLPHRFYRALQPQ